MKHFYLERTNIKENQLKMAKVGYLSRIRELGGKLLTCTVNESYVISKELAEAVESYKDLEKEYHWNIERYQEEALKEVKEDKDNA